MKTPIRRVASLALAASLLTGGLAFATRAGDDRAQAQATIAELEKSPAEARLAHEAITETKRALGRADDARAANDEKHAPELDALAREWAETGRDLVRAAEAEKRLTDLQRELSDVETKASRARALLEETVARRGRAQAKLEELEKAPPPVLEPAKPPAKAAPKARKPGKAGQP